MISSPQILIGKVVHRRTRPRKNAFAYPTVFLRLPLEQLEQLVQHAQPGQDATTFRSAWFNFNRFALLSFHCADHGTGDSQPSALRDWVNTTLTSQGLDAASTTSGQVVLMTYPRLLGFVFNPVSFWYCYDNARQLRAVIAEVNNTFGERHNYVVAHQDGAPIVERDRITARKVFHVSPFCDVRGEYRFSFKLSGDAALATVNYFDEGALLLATSISGHAQRLTATSARRAFFATPFMTLGILARIHWQALKLYAKRVQFFSKPTPPAHETSR